MATTLKLPPVVASPSTIQYHVPRFRPKTFYTPRFTMTKELRDETLEQPWLKRTDPLMPPYPYAKDVKFPEANQGLYGHATIQSGNKISKGRNKGKTLRKWFPNVRIERIRSEALEKELVIPITARVFRTIQKCGGIDAYLLGEKPARIKELGLLGWKLRWLIMKAHALKETTVEERTALGLPSASPLTETFEEVWNDDARRQILINQQTSAWQKLREKAERADRHRMTLLGPADQEVYKQLHLGTLMEQTPATLELPKQIEEVKGKQMNV